MSKQIEIGENLMIVLFILLLCSTISIGIICSTCNRNDTTNNKINVMENKNDRD